MATYNQEQVRVTRWQGSQHPSESNITRQMRGENLRPYLWQNTPNHRYAVRSHNYKRVIYVMQGNLEIVLPDANQRTRLKTGDRVEIPPGVRHGVIVGGKGVRCAEASVRVQPAAQNTSRRGLFARRQ